MTSEPDFHWDDPLAIEAGRTCDYLFKLYQEDGSPEVLDPNSKVRFKLSEKANSTTPLLDIDSIDALPGGSLITVVSLGTVDEQPAEVRVRFHQDDTVSIRPRADYFGEIGVVDAADGNVFKRAGFGCVTINASPGGDVGAT
jgi:hypothetical protein